MVPAAARRGTVFIAEAVGESQLRFGGYWDAERDGAPAMLEQMPDTGDLAQAIAWGRERAEVVLVRVVARDYFSAGDRHRAGLPRWPPPAEVAAQIEEERRQLRVADPT